MVAGIRLCHLARASPRPTTRRPNGPMDLPCIQCHLPAVRRLAPATEVQAPQAQIRQDNEGHIPRLRDAPRDQIDTVWEEKTFTVLAVNPEDGMMHISGPALASPHSSWTIDGIPVHITAMDGDLITPAGECQATPGSTICQRTHHDTVPAVHEQLSQLWTPRWLSSGPPSQDDLLRITSFCTAYLPPGKLIFEDISIAQWRRALKRFKQHAAKGADGYMLADLTHMTDQHISFLLSMLHSIEAGQVNWPIQWLEGFAIALSKATATHYRPIVILSLIYRCWASIRSRQALMQLSNLVHEDAYGFIPQREALQVWYQAQAAVELAHQNNWDQIGLSTDVEKAFNMIKREPVFKVSAHLGLPERIIRPWSGFLARLHRRFQVHNQLSQAHLSNTGFPEGCPMSVTAMVILDWNMHIYMQCFCPLVRTISYVDNIILLSAQAFAIASAFCILQV